MRFVEALERRGGEDAAAAAVEAGLAPEGKRARELADRMLSSDAVIAYMRQRAENRLKAKGFSQERICLELIRIFERCMQAEPAGRTREDGGAAEYKFDARGAMKALELLGQSLGTFRSGAEEPDRDVRVEIEVVDRPHGA
ncbi:MAG: hypothetical protein IJL69_01040 [Oscillospiraceae bacterium]|nr:hypothetical protein [Oscillospiraceae bacterium]